MLSTSPPNLLRAVVAGGVMGFTHHPPQSCIPSGFQPASSPPSLSHFWVPSRPAHPAAYVFLVQLVAMGAGQKAAVAQNSTSPSSTMSTAASVSTGHRAGMAAVQGCHGFCVRRLAPEVGAKQKPRQPFP